MMPMDLAALLSELQASLREQLCDPLDDGLELIAAPIIDQFNIGPCLSSSWDSTSNASVGEHMKCVRDQHRVAQ